MTSIDTNHSIDVQHKKAPMNALPTTAAPAVAPAARPWTATRILFTIGAAGPVVFLAVATLAGLFAPGYDMRTQPISELALGANGWIQTANFYVFGLAIIAFALGLFRSMPRPSWVGTTLLIIAGLGIIGSGVFPADLKGTPETDTGSLHNLLFLVVFLALIISYLFSALSFRKLANWRGYMWATALMPVVVFGLLFVYVGFGSDVGDPLYAVSGLIQRLLLAVAFGWMTVTGWRLLGTAPAAPPGSQRVGPLFGSTAERDGRYAAYDVPSIFLTGAATPCVSQAAPSPPPSGSTTRSSRRPWRAAPPPRSSSRR